MQDQRGRGRGRGRRGRYRDEEEEAGLTLEEWEAQQGTGHDVPFETHDGFLTSQLHTKPLVQSLEIYYRR